MGFGRLLSRIGVGAATIDAKLEKDEFVPGEEVRGVVEIVGGSLAQEVDSIYIHVLARYDSTAGSSNAVGYVDRFPVAPAISVEPGSHQEVPFTFRLPFDTPLSLGSSEVWLRTGLDIKSSFDPTDEDRISVRPTPAIQTVFEALETLGFDLKNAKSEDIPDRVRRRLHFGLELEFAPKSGEFAGSLDELELWLFPAEGSVDLVMQVDRRGLGGESYAELTVTDDEASRGPDTVAETIRETIRQHS